MKEGKCVFPQTESTGRTTVDRKNGRPQHHVLQSVPPEMGCRVSPMDTPRNRCRSYWEDSDFSVGRMGFCGIAVLDGRGLLRLRNYHAAGVIQS